MGPRSQPDDSHVDVVNGDHTYRYETYQGTDIPKELESVQDHNTGAFEPAHYDMFGSVIKE